MWLKAQQGRYRALALGFGLVGILLVSVVGNSAASEPSRPRHSAAPVDTGQPPRPTVRSHGDELLARSMTTCHLKPRRHPGLSALRCLSSLGGERWDAHTRRLPLRPGWTVKVNFHATVERLSVFYQDDQGHICNRAHKVWHSRHRRFWRFKVPPIPVPSPQRERRAATPPGTYCADLFLDAGYAERGAYPHWTALYGLRTQLAREQTP